MRESRILTAIVAAAALAVVSGAALGKKAEKPPKYMKQLVVSDLDPQNKDLKKIAGTELDPFSAEPVLYGQVGIESVDRVCKDAGKMFGTLRLARRILEADSEKLCACAQKRQAEDASPVTLQQAGFILAEAAKTNTLTDEEMTEMDLSVKRIGMVLGLLRKSVESGQSLLDNAQGMTSTLPAELSKDFRNVSKIPAVIAGLNNAVDQCKAVTSEGGEVAKQMNAHFKMLEGITASAVQAVPREE